MDGLRSAPMILLVNGEPRDVADGDRVEIVTMVGGG